MKNTSVAIIGCGSMGTAILSGMLHHGVEAAKVRTTVRRVESAAELTKKYGVTSYASEHQPNANSLAVEGCELVLIAVKPQMVSQVLDEISEALDPHALVVSVAAGITTETMQAHLPKQNPVVRAMPNTPALIGKAVTGISSGSRAADSDVVKTVELFTTVGKTLVIPEDQIDALSTISGSGPAYVFFFIEEFTKTAIKHGFSQEQASLMVQETFAGATALLQKTQEDPADLRRAVTSPNGTTMKAIAVLESANLSDLFFDATSQALARAKEIAQEMK
jgi:pyrroline-5-carboxylate reductase